MTKNKKLYLIFTSIIIMIFFTINIYSIPVIPNEQGFGIETPAGRGGNIYKITNTNPSGEGSLKNCIDKTGPRTCIFEISGTIELTQNLNIRNPYITIAGQTAPSPGITIKGAGIYVQTHDVLIKHLRVRTGDNPEGPDPEGRDSINIGSNSNDVYNVIIDHISASWSTDEIISTWSHRYKVYNITISNSIFSEALYDSLHPEGSHSMGSLIGKNSENIILKNNIFVHNHGRNPLIRDDSTNIIVINNLIYGSGDSSKSQIYFGTRGSKNIPLKASVIGNIFIPKEGQKNTNIISVEEKSATNFQIYLKDNIVSKGINNQLEEHISGRNDNSIRVNLPPIWIDNLKIIESENLKEYLLKNSGARPLDRDSVDERIINDIIQKTGNIIDSQYDVGGWPELAKNKRELAIPKNPNFDKNNNGYTNLEEWLNLYSYDLEIESNLTLHLKNIYELNKTILEPTITYNVTDNQTQSKDDNISNEIKTNKSLVITLSIIFLGIIITGLFIIFSKNKKY